MRRIVLIYLLILTSLSLFGQQFYFKNYSSDNGLPFVQVYAMCQSSDGYLYTGGYGGVSKFDGREFTNITTSQGLLDNNINAISEYSNGCIVVGMPNGISLLQDNRVMPDIEVMKLKGIQVNQLTRLADKNVLISTSQGLYKWKDGLINLVEATKGININASCGTDGLIFVATNTGLFIIDGNEVEKLTDAKGLGSNVITALTLSADKNNLVIGTNNGLSFYNLETKHVFTYQIETGLIDNTINCLLSAEDSSIWIGSPTGLMRFVKGSIEYYNIGVDNNSNIIRCLQQDYEGNIWIGTHSGICRYRDEAFTTFDKLSGPGNAFVFEIFSKDKDLYICSENRGLFKYTDGYFKRYGHDNGIKNNVCRAGTVDKNGRVYVESDGKVFELKNDRFSELLNSKQHHGPIYKLYCDSKNQLYVAGSAGFSILSNRAGTYCDTSYVALPATKESVIMTDISEDDEGGIWISAFKSGLYLYADNKLVNYLQSIGINNLDIVSARCKGNNVYVATLNGLLVIDVKSKAHYNIKKEDGLLSDIIYSIGFAKNKSVLWIGTNIGISELDLEKLEANHEIRVSSYAKNEGFIGIECNTNGIFEDQTGTVWFGTVSGLIKYSPNNHRKNQLENKLVINRIKLSETDTILMSNCTIPYDQNNITFYFRGICLTNPEEVSYQYMLKGYDKDYNLVTKENFAKYSNLNPGTYTFLVKSSNNDGVWNSKPFEFVFTIETPYYKTWWFNGIVIISSVLILYLAVVIRINYVKRQQKKEYDRKVEMSKLELKALRSQMNPHFIFNSLNSIQHYIFSSKSDEAVKYLNKFAKLIRVILSSSDKPTVAIEDDIEALKLYLELEKMRFEGKFDYTIQVDSNVDTDYDIMPPMLLQPYVENAILHGLTPRSEKGLLQIDIRREGNFIVCTITDNGIGRKRSSEIKRTMPGKSHKSFGMKITEDRLKILNELSGSQHSVKITDLENSDGTAAGTKVEIFVPII